MFNYDVKFLTCDDTISVKSNDLKSYRYESKKKHEESVYDTGKHSYCERRGGHFRPPKLNHIRQLETKLRDQAVVACEWLNDSLVTLVFSSGVIAHLTIKPNTLDVTQVLFDRYCIGKLMGHTVTSAVLSASHIIFIHPDRIATLIVFGKKNDNNVPCRISDRDPHLQSIELGGSTRKIDRHVSWCQSNTGIKVLVWSNNIADPAPWSPLPEDHANLHLYHIEGQKVSLIAFHQVESEVLFAELSHKHHNIVHIVEQASCHKNGINLFWLRYDTPKTDRISQLSQHENVTQVSLPSPARVARRSPCDLRLLVATIDGSLHIVHQVSGLTHSIRTGFIATDVRWAGEVVVAGEEGGRLLCLDRALSALHHHTKCLDLTTYLRDTRRIQILGTRKFKGGPLILATFSGGPLTLLRISHPRLLTAWLRLGRPSNAIDLLRTWDWEDEGDECLHGISEIVTSALRRNTFDLNAENAIQGALGAYLAPAAPLPASASRYAPPIHDLARKFFHHLLRRGRIEKAMSLAVELEAWDLFSDAQWAAVRARQHHLAQEAAACAAHYAPRPAHPAGSECSGSCSQCSSHSCSDSEDERPEVRKTNPPPLPRVPLPPHPTIPVPVAHNDPPSTNSIRPNLHQYLERDNTIWTTNVKDDMYLTRLYEREAKPPPKSANLRWNSVDDVLNFKMGATKIREGFVKPTTEVVQRPYDERMASTHFNHLFRSEVNEVPNTYRYNSNIHVSDTNFNERYRQDKTVWPGSRSERNKVKFSDTVTIAVVPEQPQSEVARELADSLPLSPPNKYLAAFAPHASRAPAAAAPPLGTALDYVEV